ncbi:hypothetical protein [Geodermatophilus sabuli]|uniref:HprK-related kinase B n=1 Tax=Geodermatophilus sabuli TaxID=1564158 RepID=A0A285EGW6_9ACTN|nr:hypothetical protein [Geodermatophilus sabuli]MBB3083097.1 hypothetical protein [Geodermatophilus sabuli]SNX98093.1 hypothetical protein SAMN06893097_109173 [Geodermatophilus sabuli]
MDHITASDLERIFAGVADAGPYGCFEYQGVSLGLYSDEPDLLDWFGTFFGGYFTVTANEQTDAAVYSTQDPAVFQRLKEWATSRGRPRSEYETEWAVDGRHRIVHSREVDDAKGEVEENCFVLSQPGRNVLVASPGTAKDRRRTVKRSLRNLMKLLFMERGWFPFHAAACVWNDTGICILGGKFAGKTSTLVNLLARPGARLVSNDTVFLRDGGACIEGCGFPNKAGLRIGALAAYPRLVDWIGRTTDSFYPQMDAQTYRDVVATTPADELGSRPEKIVLLATELAAQLGVPIQHVAAIDLFLVARFDPSVERSRLVPVTDPQQIKECLAVNARSLGKEKQDFLQSFFDVDDQALRAAFDTLLEEFASRVVVQELWQNANTNEHSAELVERLTRQLHEHA